MKFKIKDEDLVARDLKEAISRLPLEFRLAGLKPEEILAGFKPEERLAGLKPEEILDYLKIEDLILAISKKEPGRLKEILDKLNLN